MPTTRYNGINVKDGKGYCEKCDSSDFRYKAHFTQRSFERFIYICSGCGNPVEMYMAMPYSTARMFGDRKFDKEDYLADLKAQGLDEPVERED